MGKKTISNTFTVNTVEDGESAPYYFQEWFAWSNDASTSSVTTPPTIGGSWETSIPAQGSYAYLWRKSIRYVWNESTRQYIGETAQYVRMTGTNGTSINTRGQVANTSSRGNGTATIITDSGTQTITLSDGDAVTQLDNGHLYQWVTEGGGKWLDLGQFKGESGKTYYTHIAWATNVKYNSSGDVTSVEGFTPDKSPNDTTHLWMGVLVNESSGADPSDATYYTWSYTKGVDGTSPYFADLNNEMDAIQCKHDGGVIADQTVSTVISMWKGSAVEPFAVDNIYRNGTQLMWDGNNSGVWPRISSSGSTVSVEFDTSASIADIDDFKITIHSTNDTSVTRELHFTINGVRANAIYRLVPSHSQIVKKKDGTYEPSVNVNVTCSVKKNENGSISTPSSSEYTLEKSVNGGSYEAYSATAPSSITSDLKFRLKVGGMVVDLETIPLVSDGNKGDAGKNAGEVILTPTTIFFNGDEERYVYDTEYIQVGVGMKVDGQSCVISNISVGNTPVGISYTLSGTTITFHNTGSDYGDIEGSVSIVVTGTIIVGSITTTYIATGVLSIVCTQAGEQGQRGKIGRFFYFCGTFNPQDSDPTHGFVVNDAQAPYFEHIENGQKRYHVFNYDTNGKYTMAQMWAISSDWNNKPWEKMTNNFKYIITEAIFGAYAHFGANIINKDFRLSQYGYMRGFYDSKVAVDDDSQYQYFDDSDPFGEKDMFSKDANMRANMSFSNYIVPDSSHYVIIGNNVEFAPSDSSKPYQIENTFTPSCYRYRFKTNDRWGSWYTFSSGRYYFALSESGVSAPTSGWSYSRWAPNLVPTASKPYLWARLGTSGTPFLASSPQKNFTIEQGKYYAITFETANSDAGTFSIMIGTKNSNMFVPSSILKVEKVGNRRVYYGIFHNTYPTDFVNANVWTDISNIGFYLVAVYEAQFVPMLCEDLKTGKLVANNVVARGELHADSLYYSMYDEESNNGTIVVEDKSIVSIGTKGVGSVVKLPSPSASKGRKVEVYNYATSWRATWDGATSTSMFSCPYGSGLGYRTDTSITNKYVIFYCDGSNWWILRAEN